MPPRLVLQWLQHSRILQLKKKWLGYHARKTDGILSLLLACFNMPYKITRSKGQDFKKYGIHNGSRCRLKAWEFGESDLEMCRSKLAEADILKEMPKTPIERSLPWIALHLFSIEASYLLLDTGCTGKYLHLLSRLSIGS